MIRSVLNIINHQQKNVLINLLKKVENNFSKIIVDKNVNNI